MTVSVLCIIRMLSLDFATHLGSDVCKRHIERCARGLYSRKSRGSAPQPPQTPTADISHNYENQEEPESVAIQEDSTVGDAQESVNNQGHQQPAPTLTFPAQDAQTAAALDQLISDHQHHQQGVSVPSHALAFDMSADLPDLPDLPDLTDEYWAGPLLNFPQLQPTNSEGSPSSIRSTYSSHRISPRVAAPHASAYFAHFHHYMPIVHRGSFSLISSPELLVSIVVAIGTRYASHIQPHSTSGAQAHRLGNETWRSGLNSLAKMVGMA